jgi:large subunit ribosomal protein L21e
MVKRIGSLRRKTRKKFSKRMERKGKISVSRYFQTFKAGDKVSLGVESAVHKGVYHPKFFGRIGTIKSKTGRCYEVLIADKNKQKTLIVHPVHLKKI